jgi:hypothetical protein
MLLDKINTLSITPPEAIIHTLYLIHTFNTTNKDKCYLSYWFHTYLFIWLYSPTTNASNHIIRRQKIPFLLETLIIKALRCYKPIPKYIIPPPFLYVLPQQPCNDVTLNYKTQIITWNVGSFNTILSNLHELINHPLTQPDIIILQETKIIVTKSTKYLQNLVSTYKLIFNNTNIPTRCMNQRGLPCTILRWGLLMLIHNNYFFPTIYLKS